MEAIGSHQAQCVLIYDDQCAYCRAQMERIRRWDGHDQFEYLPNTHPTLSNRFPQLAAADLQTGLRLVTPDGRVHVAADAVYQVARRLPVIRRWAWLYRWPGVRSLADRIYAGIAARRYALAGTCKDDRCSAHSRRS